MGLVKNEIDRLNEDMGARGSVSMVFHAGGVKVGCLAGAVCSGLPVLLCSPQVIAGCWVVHAYCCSLSPVKKGVHDLTTGGGLPGRHHFDNAHLHWSMPGSTPTYAFSGFIATACAL